jgi:hypothetical protein
MPAAPPALNATTDGPEQAQAAPDYGRDRGQAPQRRGTTAGTTAEILGTRPRRFGFLFQRIPRTRDTYADPLFARPDLVEDDYYRFRRRLDG